MSGRLTSEANIQRQIMLEASARGWTLWRNNTGMGWAGDVEQLLDGSIRIHNPRPLHAGLCKGSSDLIGVRPLVLTAEHVGLTVAQFVAIEVKSARGRVRSEQQQFLDHVELSGGLALVARSVGDLP